MSDEYETRDIIIARGDLPEHVRAWMFRIDPPHRLSVSTRGPDRLVQNMMCSCGWVGDRVRDGVAGRYWDVQAAQMHARAS